MFTDCTKQHAGCGGVIKSNQMDKKEQLKRTIEDLTNADISLVFTIESLQILQSMVKSENTTISLNVEKSKREYLQSIEQLPLIGDMVADAITDTLIRSASTHKEFAHLYLCILEKMQSRFNELIPLLHDEMDSDVKPYFINPNQNYDA